MQKNYFKRYVWLLDLLQVYGRMTFQEIQDKWMNCSINDEHSPLPKRTFHNMKESIRTTFDIDIACNSEYRYFINDDGLNNGSGIKRWMLDAMSMNNILNEASELQNQVIFENVPSSRKNLDIILRAIRDKVVIEMDYQGGDMDRKQTMEVEPWCLKIFKQRWYLVGWALFEKSSGIRIYMLERASDARLTDKKISHMPKDFDGAEYFRSYYGVHQDKGEQRKEIVELKVKDRERKFLRELPLHESQEEIEVNETYSVFRYNLIPNFDFRKEIRAMGSQAEVLRPEKLKKEIIQEIYNTLKLYNNDQRLNS